MTPRIIFLGTPDFAVPSLDALARLAGRAELEIACIVTQPDRPGHRGRVTAPPVKERATALGLDVVQPARLDRAAVASLIARRPDALVWAAYGNLIPKSLLEAVNGRAVNVHASVLPRWRGAAPVQRAILAGDRDSGVTLMEGTAELDAGPVFASERVAIGDDDDAASLTARLAERGAALLEKELPRYLRGELRGTPQDDAQVTWAPKITTADAALDFQEPADALARRVRAMTPEPGAFTTVHGTRLVVTRASVDGGRPKEHGTLELRGGVPFVAAGAGWLRLDEVRPAGKRTMRGADWARGLRNLADSRLPS